MKVSTIPLLFLILLAARGKFDMSHPCGLSDERIQQLLAEETVGFTGEITFTEAYEPVTADLWLQMESGHNQCKVYGQIEVQHKRYACPPDFIHLGHRCYYFSSEMATWHSAHFMCKDLGSQLAELETRWEDNNIRSYLNRPEFAPLNRWVGGIYNWSRRQWQWASSATEMSYNGFLTQQFPRSTRWQCVYLSPSLGYRWNHRFCTTSMHYLCETTEVRVSDVSDSNEQ